MKPGWDAAEDSALRMMAAQGKSARDIADHLKNRGRLAVIGRAHRLGVQLGGIVGRNRRYDKNRDFWTMEKDDQLRSLVAQNHNAATISRIIGTTAWHVTIRSAELRLDLKKKTGRRYMTVGIPSAAADAEFDKKKVFFTGFAGSGVSLLTVDHSGCRWPYEARSRDGMPTCCGQPREDARPYCADHNARAYDGPSCANGGRFIVPGKGAARYGTGVRK